MELSVVALSVIYFSIDDVDRSTFDNKCKQDGGDNITSRLDVKNISIFALRPIIKTKHSFK